MRRLLLRAQRACAYALVVATAALGVGGCGFDVNDVPVPGYGVGGPTYPLRIEFANVLNLPSGAKVIADGVRVGQLTDISLAGGGPAEPGQSLPPKDHVVAEVDISESVRLPVGTTAELRQETPLGDVHIELTTPTAAAPEMLGPGSTIPLTDTTQSPTIEDILAALSVFIGSGAVTDLQDIIRKMNDVMPDDPRDTARIAGTLGADLTDLANDLGSIDTFLDGMQATLQDGVIANAPVLEELLTPYGVRQTTDVVNAQIGVIFVLTALGPVAPSATWLGPLLGSLDDTVAAVVPMLFGSRPLDTESPSNFKKLVELIHSKIIPFADQGPKIDLVEVTVASDTSPITMTADEQTSRIIDTLRMIGAVR